MVRDNGETCETNRFGQMKFHYCSQVVRLGIFNMVLLPFFKDEGAGSEACIRDKPAPQPKACARSGPVTKVLKVSDPFLRFFADQKTPNKVPDDVEEIRYL